MASWWSLLDFGVELVEGGAQRAGQRSSSGSRAAQFGPQDAEIELGVEEGDLEPIAGGGVAMGLGDAMDEAFEPQAPQVVGHLRGGVGAAE